MTTAGVVTEFPLTDGSLPRGLVVGPDGNLWYAARGINAISRMTPTGEVQDFPLPTANADPRYVTLGADCSLWFTEFGGHKIGRLTPAF